jgi:hypothetical protein
MKKRLLILAVFSLFGIRSIYAQGDLNEQKKVFYRNERTFAFLLNTDGWGFGYREGKRVDFLNKKFFEIEWAVLKHPKEYKLQNPYVQSSGSFIFGKLNWASYFQGGIGRQKELYKKADLGGIAIRFIYSGGLVLSLYKPYYYEVLYPVSQTDYEIRIEKFDVSIAVPQDIYSKAAFTKGISETKVLPGLYVKGGFNFEYSKEDKVIHAIEIGTQVMAFPKEIPIMANTNNRAVFLSLFVSYRFGMVIDPLDPESGKFSNLFRKKKQN